MAANPWDTDIGLSAEEAAGLIDSQFPELAPARLASLGSGWDNFAFLVNAAYVFRFPRRQMGADLMVRETQVLPHLAPLLPLPVPDPLFAGRPDGRYPYSFSGYRLLQGQTACRIALTTEERAMLAEPLARFLSSLHAVPVSSETRVWAPQDEIGRADLQIRAPPLKVRLASLAPRYPALVSPALGAQIDRLAETHRHQGATCWVHGDLYPRHLLLDAEKRLCGVIDWGDAHLGDPALDLSLVWSFLPPESHGLFREVYGDCDAAAWDRARFRALNYASWLIPYGEAIGDEAIRSVGEYALWNALRGAE